MPAGRCGGDGRRVPAAVRVAMCRCVLFSLIKSLVKVGLEAVVSSK